MSTETNVEALKQELEAAHSALKMALGAIRINSMNLIDGGPFKVPYPASFADALMVGHDVLRQNPPEDLCKKLRSLGR